MTKNGRNRLPNMESHFLGHAMRDRVRASILLGRNRGGRGKDINLADMALACFSGKEGVTLFCCHRFSASHATVPPQSTRYIDGETW